MAVQQMWTQRTRQATPERWAKAAHRAITEDIRISQINADGRWVATSGTRENVAYIVEVTRGIAHSCSCEAGQFGDEVCKHRAAYYILMGMLDPEPPAAPAVICFKCRGTDAHCPVCGGNGTAELSRQAAALIDAAERLAA